MNHHKVLETSSGGVLVIIDCFICECSLTFVKQILHMRLLEFPVFSCITRSHNEVSKEDVYRVASGETNSSHLSLLILGVRSAHREVAQFQVEAKLREEVNIVPQF